MTLTDLRSKVPKKTAKRVGRGNGSGHGTYSCRGMKGQTARAGGRRRPGFEGGQTPYLRKMPKLKGFKNSSNISYQVINIGALNIFEDNAKVDKQALYDKNLISKMSKPVKLLAGKGEIEKTLNITVDKASAVAIEKIEAKKGSVELIVRRTAPEKDQAEKEDK